MVLHLSRRAADSSSRSYHPELAYPRLPGSQTQHSRVGDSWAPRGHSVQHRPQPTELTKPLRPHPSSGSCEHAPQPGVPAWSTLGTVEFLPHLPLPAILPLLWKLLPTVTLDKLCPWGWNHEKEAQHSSTVSLLKITFYYLNCFFFPWTKICFVLSPYRCHPVLIKESSDG